MNDRESCEKGTERRRKKCKQTDRNKDSEGQIDLATARQKDR